MRIKCVGWSTKDQDFMRASRDSAFSSFIEFDSSSRP